MGMINLAAKDVLNDNRYFADTVKERFDKIC